MLTNEKETMLNKVLQLENWLEGYLESNQVIENKIYNGMVIGMNEKQYLFYNIKRNLNSIKSLINKS